LAHHRPRRLGAAWCLTAIWLAVLALLPGEALSSPVPPRFVQAQGLTDTKVQIAWTAEAGADSYRVYRDGALATEQPGTLFEDAGLAASSAHSYSVSTVSGGVESPMSTPTGAQTQAPADVSPPTQPGAITVLNLTSNSATIDWSSSSDNLKVVGYRVLRGAPDAPPSQLTQIATTDGSSQYNASALRSGTTYQFGVIALDAQNNYSPIRTVTFTTAASSDTTVPAAPSNAGVRTIPFSSSRIDITWPSSASTDISSYRIYRDGVQVGDVALPLRKTFSDTALSPNQTYTYTIRAVDYAGNLSSPSSGKTGTTLASGDVRIPRGPYLQWVTQTSARLVWWTNFPTPSVVEYGPGVLTEVATDPVLQTRHEMLIGGLTPGAMYQYRVGSGTLTSATYTFFTAAPPGGTFSFAAVGDFGGGSPGESDVANQIAAGGTKFTLTVGDNVYPDSQDPDFANFYSDFDSRLFKQYAQVINTQAFLPANGNKEYYGDGAHWRVFSLPNNERWYSYDWGDAHILVLDSEQSYLPGSPQYQYAQADLAANQDKTWRIVVIHRPPYSSTSANSNSEDEQTYLVPLFQQQKVQLVLSGNSHNYERSHPMIDGAPAAGGVVYVVTGGGGNGHNPFTIPQPAWSAFRNDLDYQHTRLTVSPQSLQLDAIRADDGVVFDSATFDAPGKIVVREDSVPDGGQDFDFTASGGLSPTSFQLDDDGDATLSNTRTFSSLTAGSGYSVSETTVPPGWEQASATCDDGSPPSNIDVAPGETVTCTFVNYQLGYARPLSATPAAIKLVPAFEPCATGNSQHGAPLALASCDPPIQSSGYLTFNASDRPAPFNTPANGAASVTLTVTCLTPGTTTETGENPPCPAAGDQVDVKITSALAGVRCVAASGGCTAAGATYDGKVLAVMDLRITDRQNGVSGNKTGTVADSPFTWGLQCAAGACSSTTSADAVLPGLAVEGKRAVWAFDMPRVLDGGPDGDLAAGSAGCPPACAGNDGETVFLRAGLFTP
jgi:hypothetical protein